MFYAHSENSAGKKHKLIDHLLRTAELARAFAPSKKLEELFYLSGLMHDVGKYQNGFQQYLLLGKPRTPHAGIGAFIAKTLAKQYVQLQFAIQGHHAGMPDNQERKSNNEGYAEQENTANEITLRFQKDILKPGGFGKAPHSELQKDLLLAECSTRFLFSALTDADWLDTESHFDQDSAQTRKPWSLECDTLIQKLENEFAALPINGSINRLRTKARKEVEKYSDEPLGFFSLQLPTGLGKTLTSMYWAVLHARLHKLKRIIIVLPYINIIDQTASILKRVFSEDIVLEHHSGIAEEADENYGEERLDKATRSAKQLACENWDAPIIVTTAVQFFESLFSNRPFKCRKNHNIAESVVIFDEVQTLPKQYAEPTIVLLKNIVALLRTSFLFCTATMPAFAKGDNFDGIESITPLIKNPKKYFEATKRVEYTLLKKLKPVELAEVSERLVSEKDSYLAIVNTKAIARELYGSVLGSHTHERYYHLSTGMCPHHRKKTIVDMTEDLRQGRRIGVVSTQLVEAGVDLDFPIVYRAIAPLDAIIQAAGRCNRNGVRKKGRVILFDLHGHRMPDETYRSCAAFSKGLIQDDPEILHKADSFRRYYEQVIALFVDADKYGITEERKQFNFKTVNEQYRIIDDRTTPLFVAEYSAESKTLLDDVGKFFSERGFILREHYRKLQQYSVQVYKTFLEKYDEQIEVHNIGVRIWHGKYDNNLGLAPQDVETVF
jgi:CRISPR-associated endonuclease/helicase Cas3